MQRMFLALVADMRRLGAHLVSANFGSVLICTGKRNMSAAGARAPRRAGPLTAACMQWVGAACMQLLHMMGGGR